MLTTQQQLSNALSRFGPDYTSLVFNRYCQPRSSVEASVEGGSPTFITVTNYFSRGATLMWLRFHIAETFAFLGIYDTASKEQIRQTAQLILDHEIYGHLNLDEFLLFLSRFKRGDYGKIYQSARPNPQEFLMCLRPFWNELADYRIRLAKREEEARQKTDSENSMTYEEWLEIKTITAMYNSDYTVP